MRVAAFLVLRVVAAAVFFELWQHGLITEEGMLVGLAAVFFAGLLVLGW